MSARCATSCRTKSRLLRFPEPDRRRVAVAANWLADPGDRVQRRVACRPIVRVGAGLQQGDGELEMPVFDRQNQRACGLSASRAFPALRPHRFVHFGSGLEQPENHVGASFANGEEQRRKPGRERSAEVRSGFEEGIDDFDVAIRRSPHQGGLSLAFTGVDVGSPCEKRLDRTRDDPCETPSSRPSLHQGAWYSRLPRLRAATSTMAVLPLVQASERGVTP